MNNNILQCSEKKYSRYKITKPIRLIQLFSGIGAQAKSLENLHANFEHYKVCEIDKYALASYNAIHNTNFKVSDIKQLHASDLEIVDTNKYEYILTYSFPCQSLSLAGKQEGMDENSNTASSLLWEVKRILNECKELPQILLMENVPQVHSKKNIDNFEKWQKFLTSLGYKNYWQDLNAKDYGIPQNRNRCFMISILNSEDIYSFPEKEELKLRLKDMLEEEVEEKYYLSDVAISKIVNWKAHQKPFERVLGEESTSPCITARGAGEDHSGMILFSDTLKTTSNLQNECLQIRENILKEKSLFTETQAKMINKNGDVKRYINSNIVDKFNEGQCADISFPNGYNKACRVHDECPAINVTTTQNSFIVKNNLRIRKLTPKECFRLMGFSDEDFDKASKFNSPTQLYKQAGNSIVVNVLMAIFKELL
jgi:DNA (cytosine-5)-methyltransferase 1